MKRPAPIYILDRDENVKSRNFCQDEQKDEKREKDKIQQNLAIYTIPPPIIPTTNNQIQAQPLIKNDDVPVYIGDMNTSINLTCSNITNYFSSALSHYASSILLSHMPIYTIFTLSVTSKFFYLLLGPNFQPGNPTALSRCREFKISILKELLSSRIHADLALLDWLIRYTGLNPKVSLSVYKQNSEVYETDYKTFHPCVLSLAAKYGNKNRLEYLHPWIKVSNEKLYDYAIIGKNVEAIMWLHERNYHVPFSKPNLVNGKFWFNQIVKITDNKVVSWVLTKHGADVLKLKDPSNSSHPNNYIATALAHGNYTVIGHLLENFHFPQELSLDTVFNALKLSIILKNSVSINILEKDYIKPNYDSIVTNILFISEFPNLLSIAALFNNTYAFDWLVKTCKMPVPNNFIFKLLDKTYVKFVLNGVDYDTTPKINFETFKVLLLSNTNVDCMVYLALASEKTPSYFNFDLLKALEFLLAIRPISGNGKLCEKLWKKCISESRAVDSSKSIVNFDLVKILANPCYNIPKTTLVCAKAARFGISIQEMEQLRKFCPWDKMTIMEALDFDRQQLAHWAINENCPVDIEVAFMATHCKDKVAFNLLLNKNCPWSEQLYNDPNYRLDNNTTLGKNFPRLNIQYVKVIIQ